MSIGDRLRSVRNAVGLTQEAMANRVGLGAASWKRLELENRAPKGEILSSLIELGFSSDWILTGKGEMISNQSRSNNIDKEILRDCISVLRENLKSRKVTLSPDKEAEVISLLYDIAAEQEDPALRKVDPTYAARILRLVS